MRDRVKIGTARTLVTDEVTSLLLAKRRQVANEAGAAIGTLEGKVIRTGDPADTAATNLLIYPADITDDSGTFEAGKAEWYRGGVIQGEVSCLSNDDVPGNTRLMGRDGVFIGGYGTNDETGNVVISASPTIFVDGGMGEPTDLEVTGTIHVVGAIYASEGIRTGTGFNIEDSVTGKLMRLYSVDGELRASYDGGPGFGIHQF